MKYLISKLIFGALIIVTAISALGIVLDLNLASPAQAAINAQINYQGKLTNTSNVSVADGTYNMEFILYDDPTLSGAHIKWTETRTGANKVQVTNGLFSVMLGSVTSLSGVNFNQTLYLGVNIGGTGSPSWDGEMTPRKILGAVPAAITSDAVNGTGGVRTTLNSTTALAVAGAGTDYALQVDTSTGSSVTGLKVTSNTSGNGIALAAISSGSNEALTLNAKGTGTITIGTAAGSSGDILFGGGVGSTGCTVTNSNGAFACTSTISSGVAGGTIGGYTVSGNTSGTISILPQAAAGTYNFNLPTTAGTTGYLLTSAGGGGSAMTWTDPATLSGSSRISGLLAANATNSINNLDYAQTWAWDSLSSNSALTLSSTSTAAASNTQTLLNVALSGINATGSQTTYGAQFSNTHGGSGTNIAAYFTASGGTNNYAAIFNNGNVGIGTSTPGSKLTVAGNIDLNVNGSPTIGNTSFGNNSITFANTGNISLSAPNALTSITSTQSSGSADQVSFSVAGTISKSGTTGYTGLLIAPTLSTLGSGSNYLFDAHGSSSSRVVIDSAGSVGIGTASPSYPLHVYSANNYGYIRTETANNNYEGRFEAVSPSSNIQVAAYGTTSGSGILDGNVGVSTFSDTLYLGSYNSDVSIATGSTLSAKLTVLNGGNIGIGDSSPAALLTVGSGDLFQVSSTGKIIQAPSTLATNGDIGFQQSITVGNSTASQTFYGNKLTVTNAQSTNANTLYGQYINFADVTGVANTVTGLFVDASTANSADTTYSAVFTGGNVGVGTPTPTYLLHIKNVANVPNLVAIDSSDSTAYSPSSFQATSRLTLISGNASGAHNLIRFSGGGSDEANFGTVQNASGYAEFIWKNNNGAAYGERMRLDSNGNLGIGDSSPAALLTVGNGDLFQVNTSGAIAAAAGITSSGTIQFSGLASAGTQCVQASSTGVLSVTGSACGSGGGGISLAPSSPDTTSSTNSIENITATGLTSGNFLNLKTTTSAFTGAGILMDFANASGSYSGNFIDARVNTVAKFVVSSSGAVTAAGLLTGNAGLAVSGGTVTLTSTGASTYTVPTNTASAFNLTNGTDSYYKVDTRTSTSGVSAHSFSHASSIFVTAAPSSQYINATFTPGTYIMSGTSNVTGTGAAANLGVLFDQLTVGNNSNPAFNITEASNVLINGAVRATNTNATVTNLATSYGLNILSGAALNTTFGTVTTGIGLSVNAPTGATNNYAALFNGGNVGVGTTGPDRKLDVLDASNPQLRLTTTDGSVYSDMQNTANANLIVSGSTLASSSAIQYGLQVTPTINQTSTAGFTALDVNVTETGVTNGPNNLADFRVGGNSKLAVRDDGSLTLQGNGNIITPFGGFGSYDNYLVRSEEFNTTWTTSSVTAPTADTQVAPDGSTTAESLATTGSGGYVQQDTSTAISSTTYAFSVWARSASGTQNFGMRVDGTTTGTGTEKTFTATTSWQRYYVTQAVGSFTGNVRVRIFPGTSSSTGTIYAWGAQLDNASVPSQYAKTTGAALTNPSNRGLLVNTNLTNTTASGFLYGERHVNLINSTTAGTHVGEFIRTIDNTSLDSGQVVRGLEVQAFSGSNVNGTNTGIASFGYTFGIQATTTAQAAAQAAPAAIFADLDNGTDSTTKARGNAIRAYTNDATSATLVQFYQESSAYTGTGLQMDFGNNSGSFVGNYIDLMYQGSSKMSIAYSSSTGKLTQTYGATGSTVDYASGTNGNTYITKIPQKATSGTCASAAAEGMIYQNTGGTQVGHICIDGPSSGTPNKLRFYAEQFNATSTDVAENYSDANNSLVAGDVVMLDSTIKYGVTKTTSTYTTSLVGVISTSPGVLLTGINESNHGTELVHPKPVVLSGRAPVKVTNESGDIQPGDFLTASSTPGYAMKATKAGPVIGQALESFTGGIGKVDVFIKATNYNGATIESEMAGLIFPDATNAPELAAINSTVILNHLLDRLAQTNSHPVSEVNTDVVVAGREVITPTVTAKTLRTDFLDSATAEGSLSVASTTVFNGGLKVDSISSITNLISFQNDVEFIGTPYFNTDTAGFAVIKAGVKTVDVKFTHEYLVEPIVNASFSFAKADGQDQQATQNFLSEGVSYAITNNSKTGFTIMLNKPTTKDVRLSWTALAVHDAHTFMSEDAPAQQSNTGTVAGITDPTIPAPTDVTPDPNTSPETVPPVALPVDPVTAQ